LKSTVTQPTPGGWNLPNTGATNSSGFSAEPGGLQNGNGGFNYVGNYGNWWSSSPGTNGLFRALNSTSFGFFGRNYYLSRSTGLSVRCLRD
jgi:uncharacterized protein (TIGR02145 family)